MQDAHSWEVAVWKKQPCATPGRTEGLPGGLFPPSAESTESGPALQPPFPGARLQDQPYHAQGCYEYSHCHIREVEAGGHEFKAAWAT